MMSINLDDIAILNIRGVDYRCIINRISETEAANLLQNVDLTEKRKRRNKNKKKYYAI